MPHFTGNERATTHAPVNGTLACTYHQTVVATFDPITRRVTLDSGGWRTATTKQRMNQCAHAWGADFSVYQKDHVWLVKSPRVSGGMGEMPFQDGMQFPA